MSRRACIYDFYIMMFIKTSWVNIETSKFVTEKQLEVCTWERAREGITQWDITHIDLVIQKVSVNMSISEAEDCCGIIYQVGAAGRTQALPYTGRH